MSPFERMTEKFSGSGFSDEFTPDLWLHLQHGYVISTPRAFAMARPVWSHWSAQELGDIARVDPDGDCWFIWALSGDLAEAARWLPGPKKFLAFARRGQPRLVHWEKLSHAITRQFSSHQGAGQGTKAVRSPVHSADGVHEEAVGDGWLIRDPEDDTGIATDLGEP